VRPTLELLAGCSCGLRGLAFAPALGRVVSPRGGWGWVVADSSASMLGNSRMSEL
jgi:hypothetical protein